MVNFHFLRLHRRRHSRLRWRHFGLLLPLLLAACATASKRPVYYPPAPASYFTVDIRSGDTLSEIAYRYQVKEEDLLALNTIYDRNVLATGDVMRVPAYGHFRGPEQRGAVRPRGRPVAGSTRVARSNAIERSTLAAPRGSPPRGASNVSYVPVPQRRPGPLGPPVLPTPRPAQQEQGTWLDWLAPADARDPQGRTNANTAARDSFLWPVVGQVIAPFGQSAGGGRNDGINISTRRGTPVRASAAGTVTYVGNELKGYGNLVLIRHDNGFVTAYAHSDTVVVQRGDRVTRGEIIGYAGSTGDVTEPQLHFELRVGTKPVDPKPYLVTSS